MLMHALVRRQSVALNSTNMQMKLGEKWGTDGILAFGTLCLHCYKRKTKIKGKTN